MKVTLRGGPSDGLEVEVASGYVYWVDGPPGSNNRYSYMPKQIGDTEFWFNGMTGIVGTPTPPALDQLPWWAKPEET